MDVPAASRVPQVLWIDIATALRDLPPLLHINVVDPPEWRRCHHTNRHSRFCYATKNTRVRHLSEVCRFLHNVLDRLLYNTVVTDGFDARQTPSLIIQTLVNRSDLLDHTRTLIIFASQTLNPVDFNALSLLLPHFHFLQHVYIICSTITPKITQFLAGGVHLKSLWIEDCDWTSEVPVDWSKGCFGRQLTELSLNGGTDRHPKSRLDQPRYEQLFAPTLRTLELDASFVVQFPFSWTPSLTHLRTLTVGMTHSLAASKLSEFLQLLPSVEELRVDDFFRNGNFQLSADSLPRLRSLTGSFELAQLFSNKSEMEHLHIQAFYLNNTGNDDDVEPVGDYVIPFPSLKMLVVQQFQCNEETLGILARQYPLLTRLVIFSHNLSAPRRIDEDIITAFRGFSHLEVFRLVWIPPSDDISLPSGEETARERDLLERIRRLHCPRLQEAGISPGHRWCYLPDGGWIPVMRQFICDVRL